MNNFLRHPNYLQHFPFLRLYYQLFSKLCFVGGTSGPSQNLDHAVRVIDLETRSECFAPLKGHDGYLHDISYCHQTKTLASASEDGSVKLWDLRNPKGHAQGT